MPSGRGNTTEEGAAAFFASSNTDRIQDEEVSKATLRSPLILSSFESLTRWSRNLLKLLYKIQILLYPIDEDCVGSKRYGMSQVVLGSLDKTSAVVPSTSLCLRRKRSVLTGLTALLG
jgi:hypothetical protein